MFKIKLNKTLVLLWLAASCALITSVSFQGNTLWNNVIFIVFLALLVITVCWHYAHKPAHQQPEPAQRPQPVVAQPADQGNTVILILGPYAAKWFSNPATADNTRFSSHAIWILIPDPETLQKRLKHIAAHHPSAQVLAFFPFLPDVYENTSIIISQLAKWQNSFSALSLPTPLSCVLTIYIQLSNERLSHNSDNAYWTGDINLANQKALDITAAFQSLSQKLESQDTNNTRFAAQRYAMAHNLFIWLNQSGVTSALQTLFSHTSFQLTDVILSDNGKGFIKHGAWSAWLEKTLGILPGLASALSLPPFPKVINWRKPQVIDAVKPPMIMPISRPKWLWSLCFVTLLLALHMAHTLSQEKVRYKQFNQQIVSLDNINNISIQHIADNIVKLSDMGKILSACVNSFDITRWGFSQCEPLLNQINQRIEIYQDIPMFSSAQMVPLFDSNSTTLKLNTQTNDMLASLLLLVENNQGSKILIVGHSDNTGNASFNMKLSEQRALVVRDWLIKYSSRSAENFIIRGVGALEPVASNDTKAGQEQNRRVEVLLLPIHNQNVGA
ncbi:OmpA family protein [Yersinia pekkanenii]|uniref:OMPA family outer membrane porin n=1 Tax=Yersinia pekkanenii TaxID=1288385 RepID=A0A0T9Q7P2_9GAMM|nr:OmpA family protein [Yersinia pekkanenii]CNH99564.1 putative OMPA family outer membrane porin [Yersinia pekkanenii]CRY65040.1 putative OMPA family outer membrane porin [Yersinia pekkanenii]